MFCSKCGKPIEPNFKVCPYCGAPNTAAQFASGSEAPVSAGPAVTPVPPAAPVRPAGSGIDVGRIIAVIGAIIAIISLFMPVLSVLGFNAGSYLFLGKDLDIFGINRWVGDELASHIIGLISAGVLVLSLIFVLVKLKALAVIFAFLAFGWSGFISGYLLYVINQEEFASYLVSYGFGFYGLLLGSLILMIGAFMMHARKK